jgi:polyhydroxyalkanoate synthesis regulator phasin
MPKKQIRQTQAEQSERFEKTVADLVAAGELNPTEADASFEKLIGKLTKAKDGAKL